MTYFKRIIRKLNEYFKDTKEIKYKKLKASILKNTISRNISKNVIGY